nr:phosphopantothenoylcysteine decarboxylase isoform X5 [Saimiri boliviensis boliviensis]
MLGRWAPPEEQPGPLLSGVTKKGCLLFPRVPSPRRWEPTWRRLGHRDTCWRWRGHCGCWLSTSRVWDPVPEPAGRWRETCVIRAWDRSKPLLFCPAMNTAMWEHPITAQQLHQLKAFGYVEIPCVAKKLVCGDKGLGAMAEVGTIVDKVKEVLFQHSGFQQS